MKTERLFLVFIQVIDTEALWQKAFDAFKRAVFAFPYSSSDLQAQTDLLAPDALFRADDNSPVKQLMALVDRVTYIGACELFFPPEEVSLHTTLRNAVSLQYKQPHLDASVVGILLERQYCSLHPSRWKEGVQTISIQLLKDALDTYNSKAEDGSMFMPIRRARILIRCMELVYRDSAPNSICTFGFVSVEEMAREIEYLCTMQVGIYVFLRFQNEHAS